MIKQRVIKIAFLLFITNYSFAQNIITASIFGDNMVLQQGINVPIWGTAKPDEYITISFIKKLVKTRADKAGKWMLKLPIMKAGGPFKMVISSASDSIVYPSVFVGEVWLAGGQSNMQLLMPEVKNAGKEIAEANYPAIRFFTVGMNISHKPLEKVKGEWQICTPENARKFSAVAYFFARELYQQKQVPVGIIASSWGASPAEAWTSGESLLTYPDFKDSILRYQQLQADWELLYTNYLAERDAQKTLPAGTKKPPVLPLEKNYPSALYNAMIEPLVPYGIKGVIWYQGENNARKAIQYRSLFPLLIKDWRTKWQNNTLPFVFVQLANHKVKIAEPVFKDEWALLREAQLMTLNVPNTGMAVTIDIGEANNIHPKNKQDVGKRLFLAANHLAYNATVTYSGPIYQSIKIAGSEAEISFTHVGKGLVIISDTSSGFAIAGADKKFYWANAKVKDNKVIVSSSMVLNPIAVRYAWASNPDALFYNLDSLPASPFRTDDW